MKWIINLFEKPLIKLTLIYFAFLAFLLFFGDRWGLEGDDISQLEGAINFQYKGTREVYQYFWHPLTYQLNILVNKLVGNPKFLFYMPQFFEAATLTLLLWSAYLFTKKKLNLLLILAFILLLPELIFTGLYYNSTAFAMLPIAVTLVFLFYEPSQPSQSRFRPMIRYWIIGFGSVLAMFFRFEFVLSIPLIWYCLFIQKTPKKELMVVLASSFSAVILGLITGILNPAAILRTVVGYDFAIADQTLSFHHSLKVILISINWLVWIVLFVYLTYFLVSKMKARSWKALLVFIPILIVLYPILTKLIFSPKYVVPAIMFLPILLCKIALELQENLGKAQFKRLTYVVVAVAFLFQLVSIEPTKHFPYAVAKSPPSFLPTSDGQRSPGAYLYEYDKARKSLDVKESGFPEVEFPRQLANLVSNCDHDVDIVYLDKQDNQAISPWWWAWPGFYLELKGYKIERYIPEKEIILGFQNQTVRMKILKQQEFSNYKDKNLLAKVYIGSGDSFKEKASSIIYNAQHLCIHTKAQT